MTLDRQLSTSRISRSLTVFHSLLAVQSLVIILVSINRTSTFTLGFVAPNEFLRWVDLNNMLVLPLISMPAFYLLKKQVEYDSAAREERTHLALNLAFIVGVYLLAVGYGNHEITNYLHARFCTQGAVSDLCRIVIFNDDAFSHWVFFVGLVLVNTALLLLQLLFPYRGKVRRGDLVLLIVNGLFIGAGIFANLAFEEIGMDLYIVALLAVLAFSLLWRRGLQPLFVYYSAAFGWGLVATALYKILI